MTTATTTAPASAPASAPPPPAPEENFWDADPGTEIARPPLFLVVGAEPGLGKTHLGLTFPGPVVVLDTEFRADEVLRKFRNIEKYWKKIERWDDVRQAVGRAMQRHAKTPGTFVFDSGSDLNLLAEAEVLEEIAAADKKAHKTLHWGPVNKRFKGLFGHLRDRRWHAVFTARLKDEWKGEDRTGTRTLGGFVTDKLIYHADFALILERDKDGKRIGRVLKNGAKKVGTYATILADEELTYAGITRAMEESAVQVIVPASPVGIAPARAANAISAISAVSATTGTAAPTAAPSTTTTTGAPAAAQSSAEGSGRTSALEAAEVSSRPSATAAGAPTNAPAVSATPAPAPAPSTTPAATNARSPGAPGAVPGVATGATAQSLSSPSLSPSTGAAAGATPAAVPVTPSQPASAPASAHAGDDGAAMLGEPFLHSIGFRKTGKASEEISLDVAAALGADWANARDKGMVNVQREKANALAAGGWFREPEVPARVPSQPAVKGAPVTGVPVTPAPAAVTPTTATTTPAAPSAAATAPSATGAGASSPASAPSGEAISGPALATDSLVAELEALAVKVGSTRESFWNRAKAQKWSPAPGKLLLESAVKAKALLEKALADKPAQSTKPAAQPAQAVAA